MLKGILFVIAIIITFEIGTTVLDYYNGEQAKEVLVEAVEQEQNTSETGAKGEGTETSKTLLNLKLPEGVEFDEELDEDISSEKRMEFKEGNGSNKASGLNVKPIVEFEPAERKPEVSGIKMDLKKEF